MIGFIKQLLHSPLTISIDKEFVRRITETYVWSSRKHKVTTTANYPIFCEITVPPITALIKQTNLSDHSNYVLSFTFGF